MIVMMPRALLHNLKKLTHKFAVKAKSFFRG